MIRLLLVVLVLLLEYSAGQKAIGESCERNSSCIASADYGSVKIKFCKDGICQCLPEVELRYTQSLEPRCDYIFYSVSALLNDCTPTSCNENFECVDRKFYDAFPFGGINNKTECRCKQGYLRQGDKCIEASHQKVLQRCYVPQSGPMHSCDIDEFSYCKNEKCICFDTYFANKTSEKCEPMENYLQAFNISAYRVKPEEYCTKKSQCISGLECKDFKCSCPEPCTYKREEESCDCGEVVKPTATGPIVLGIILGIFIMIFWGTMVKRTIRKFAEKKAAQFSTLADSPQATPSRNSYALSPVSPSATNETAGPPVGLVMDGRQSPLVSYDSLPYKPGLSSPVGPPPPPQASLYGINPLEAPPSYSINPVAPPPPYTEMPSSTEFPYSINPPTVGGAAPPMPYPSNPADPTSASPYTTSPSSVPYPPNPSVQPSGVPAYPAHSYGATSTTLPENNAASSPYNPSYP